MELKKIATALLTRLNFRLVFSLDDILITEKSMKKILMKLDTLIFLL